MDLQKIGACLRDLRREKGLTQEQLAERFSVSQRTVSRWETGTATPDLDVLLQLADFYEVDLRALLNGEQTKQKMSQETIEIVQETDKYSKVHYNARKRVLIALLIFAVTAIILLMSYIVLSHYYNLRRIPVTQKYEIPFFKPDHVYFGDPPRKAIPNIAGETVERTDLSRITNKTVYSFDTVVLGTKAQTGCYFSDDSYLTEIHFVFPMMERKETRKLFDGVVAIIQNEYQNDPAFFCGEIEQTNENTYDISLGLNFGATGIFYTVSVEDNKLFITCIDLW